MLTFSPDGSKVLALTTEYTDIRPNGNGGFQMGGPKPREFRILDPATNSTKPLRYTPSNDNYLSGWDWSPDGKNIVYVSYQKDAIELWLLDLATGKTQQITNGGAVNVEPRWSPDGKWLVFVSTSYNKRFHVFRADVRDGRLENVVRLTGETKSTLPRYYYSAYDMEISPVWARDGQEILFVSNKGHIHGTGGFWRMKAEPEAEAREIHYEETNWRARPDFSPDGSRMVYSSYLGRQWHQLWVMPANGGDAFPISYGDWDDTNVRWSPDGKQLAFISNRGENTELWVQAIPGSEQRRIEVQERRFLGPTMTVALHVTDHDGHPAPARVSLTSEDGRFFAPNASWIHADDGFDRKEQPFEAHYFHTAGDDTVTMPAGKFYLEVMSGFERPLQAAQEITTSGTNRIVHVQLKQKWPLGKDTERWISGDLHVHMNYGGTYRNSAPGRSRPAPPRRHHVIQFPGICSKRPCRVCL
jgi:WD40 repeat protein